MSSALRREPGGLRELARRMKITQRLLAVQNRRLGRPLEETDLEDVAQDALLAIWRKLPTYEGRAALESWMYRFCFLELMNAVRRRGRAPRGLEEVEEPVGPPVARASNPGSGLAPYLRHLASREAEVVRLRHLEELAFDEIGATLGISTSSAKTHYYRGLKKLRELPATER